MSITRLQPQPLPSTQLKTCLLETVSQNTQNYHITCKGQIENSQVLKQNVPSSVLDHCLGETMLLTIFPLRLVPLEQPLRLFRTSTKVCTSGSYCHHPQLSYTTAQKPRLANNFSLNHHFHVTLTLFSSLLKLHSLRC